jgi:hypothetical protein
MFKTFPNHWKVGLTAFSTMAFLFSLATQSEASIQIISAPTSVVAGQLTSDTIIYGFQETTGIGSDQEVDDLSTATAKTIDDLGDLANGTVTATFDSWLFHFNPATGSSGNAVNSTGIVTFDKKILGVIVLDESLDGTDASLGSGSTAYPTGTNWRGLELNATPSTSTDRITVSLGNDQKTISFDFLNATTGTDQVRLLVEAGAAVVPEPTTFVVWSLLGLVSTSWLRRKTGV